MEIKLETIYRIRPRKNLAPFQYELRYAVDKVEKNKVYFHTVEEFPCNYDYTIKQFEKYLIEA